MAFLARVLPKRSLRGKTPLILCLLGTNPYPFPRLANGIVSWQSMSGEHVIMQSGNTPVISKAIEAHEYFDHEHLLALIRRADVVVVQGGFGSLRDCIANGARTVAVPRRIDLGESLDDQSEIVEALADEGLCIPVFEIEALGVAIDSARKSAAPRVRSNSLALHIADTVNDLLNRRT